MPTSQCRSPLPDDGLGLVLRQSCCSSFHSRFGVSGICSVPGETNPHGRDEKLRTRSFYEGLDFLYQLVKQVSGTVAM